ncbi:hypothetical protein BVY03_02050 [bacterium K02(2017)]|nr:hypothetical protein BVY03_02050 [bacterium K02(2017)]
MSNSPANLHLKHKPLSINDEFKKGTSPEEERKNELARIKLENLHIKAPKWVSEMKSLDILALVFSDIPLNHDFFEKAIIVLFNRGWGFTRIFILHFLVVSPLFWLPQFAYIKHISFFKFILRWPLLPIIPAALYFFIYYFVITLRFDELLFPLSSIILSSYCIAYMIISFESLYKWRHAYIKMKNYYQIKYSKKKKKEAPKKTRAKMPVEMG